MLTIDRVKKDIDKKIGSTVLVVYNGSRNKIEEYNGVIKESYNYIFIVELSSFDKKSFCFSDIITKKVKIYFNDK